jgi:large subunit ribosomal protein L21
MYAVIRAGGKQYRVAPGDVIRVEHQQGEGNLEFEVLAVSSSEGRISKPPDARVIGQVLEHGRGRKVLVFHYKRKKQYKKLQGHRQPFTAVRIAEIQADGQKFEAPPLEARKPKATEGGAAPEEAVAPKKKAGRKASTKPAAGVGPATGAGSTTGRHAGTAKRKGGPS